MYIRPQKDYLLVKLYEEKQEKKCILILPDDQKQKYLEVVVGTDKFDVGMVLIPHPHKPKFPVGDKDVWLIHQDDIIGHLEF